ncbi:MAG: glycoside hydrolase family 3 C-terminal domain-containing protein [Clostridia bacterium]|nr:glycoside hydrolase family 3 C-terminal domain-containing protein [Clostridia bacterium]
MARKVIRVISLILFNIMAIVFVLSCLIGYLIDDDEVSSLVSQYGADFGFDSGFYYEPSISISSATYPTWYSSVEDVLDGNGAVAAATEAEGAVLLKNSNNALPLNKNTDTISFFGATAYSPMYSLGGAGAIQVNSNGVSAALSGVHSNYRGAGSTSNRRQYLWQEMKNLGYTINDSLVTFYNNYIESNYNSSTYYGNDNGNNVAIRDSEYGSISSYTSGYNTCIYVTGRMGTEAVDLPPYGSSGGASGDAASDYLKFTSNEKQMLSTLGNARQAGTYSKFIVVFNQSSPMEEDLESIFSTYHIDAAVWIGYPGSDGLAGVASLLNGDSAFSGNLSDMWYTGRTYNPSYAYYSKNQSTIREDMYIGYRYAETRYEDSILGTSNAGSYQYSTYVDYPFGYGYTYADGDDYDSGFDVEIESLTGNDDPDKDYYTAGSNKTSRVKYDSGNDSPYLAHDEDSLRPEDERRAKGEDAETDLGDYDDLILTVNVTNKSQVAGKKVVQVYLQQAYNTSNTNVQKTAVELVGYAKTSKLEPEESEELTINIDANKYFASYDNSVDNGDGTFGQYILDQGDYLLTVASNSHQAINNILKYKVANPSKYTVSNSGSIDSLYGTASADKVAAVTVSEDRAASYTYWTQGGATPTNQFTESDPDSSNTYTTVDGDSNVISSIKTNGTTVHYMTRSDWTTYGSTEYDSDSTTLSASSAGTELTNDLFGYGTQLTGVDSSTISRYYGNDLNAAGVTFGNGSSYTIMLSEMIGIEYDERRGASEEDVAKWNTFLDQLTWSDYKDVLKQGRRRTTSVSSIGKYGTNDVNASNGISWKFDLSDGGTFAGIGFANSYDESNATQYPTGYPCEGIIASTFNIEIAYAVGQALGEDALWAGVSGLYGFGLGLHRNPYHGRSGEYYSEDPYLTGTMGGYESLGCQSKGCYVYNKHFVLNDQETNRSYYNTWLREQTMREIYLRPFEIAIEIGDGMNVMTSFNNIGGVWSGQHYGLMHNVLREEFGMAGFAVSDWAQTNNMNLTWGVLAGNDLLDGPNNDYSFGDYLQNVGYYTQAMRDSVQRLLYTVVNSNRYNGMSSSDSSGFASYTVAAQWPSKVSAVLNIVDYVFAFAAVFVVITTIWVACSALRSKVKKNPDYKGNDKKK